ncbi:MAG: 2-oxoglutarate dehydrogenase, E2 component, dihydrolipoamide succinyltransferase [Bacteroidota bacterium]|nr:2-oxoglutarate dehydrogenase, E2 component, dihydrolipoamide succinyltransferase [Bacteroidota bacterium]
MRIDVVMPKMGESVNEGTIIKWHKKKGDRVKKDEIIFEISTDKVDTEIPSPSDGILSEVKVFEQETVPVDTVVAVIETAENSEMPQEKTPVSPSFEKKQAETPSTTQIGGNLIEIPMPKMGESVMEGTIIKWHKKPGDPVKKDEVLFEISTDKVDTEVPSPEDGTLAEILVGEQQTVEVGTIVARITSKGGVYKEPAATVVKTPIVESENIIEKRVPQMDSLYAEIKSNEAFQEVRPSAKRFYSPLVLNIAQKENVAFEELENIPGSGVEGRVTKKDILDYISNKGIVKTKEETPSYSYPKKAPEKSFSPQEEQKQVPQERTQQEKLHQPSFSDGNNELIPMDNIRQKIMMHMVKSRDTSVHVSAMIEVDMMKIHNFIKINKDDFLKRENIKLTYMPFIANACIKALKEYPYLNSSIDGTNIVLKRYINLGIAVSVEPNGLIVPNIKNADEKNIIGLAKAIAELSNKARTKKLLPDDISNGTFTITNYGVFGTLFGTPIINQPEVAILGVGTVIKKPVVVELDGADTIAIRPMMYLSLSHDHRLIDGMLGGKFLKFMKDTIENFDLNDI